MDPIILSDNRFLDGTPTATDTATGYDVLHISDLREYTEWKAASSGTKYLTVDCATAHSADALGIASHNLGTASATVSVESSSNGSSWTERLAGFAPTTDKPILKTFTTASARYWRVKIVTGSVAAQVAVCVLGVRMEFPFGPDAPFTPYVLSAKAESNRSKSAITLGVNYQHRTVKIAPSWTSVPVAFVDDYFIPFLNDHATKLEPFFFAADLTAYPADAFFVALSEGADSGTPKSNGVYYDRISLDLDGRWYE